VTLREMNLSNSTQFNKGDFGQVWLSFSREIVKDFEMRPPVRSNRARASDRIFDDSG